MCLYTVCYTQVINIGFLVLENHCGFGSLVPSFYTGNQELTQERIGTLEPNSGLILPGPGICPHSNSIVKHHPGQSYLVQLVNSRVKKNTL